MTHESITLGGGCFWCVEAVFQLVRGVVKVESGYSNGRTSKPTYEDVCSGTTGYVEVLKIEFDPAVITLKDILYIFFATHPPPPPLSLFSPLAPPHTPSQTQYQSFRVKRKESSLRRKLAIKKAVDAFFHDEFLSRVDSNGIKRTIGAKRKKVVTATGWHWVFSKGEPHPVRFLHTNNIEEQLAYRPKLRQMRTCARLLRKRRTGNHLLWRTCE